ncbi:MAG: hypothetical protein IPO01_17850 [Chitinophagaceae bacterium]|nr:hypothetical protein [Chitinophagaceae bacterium]
MGLLQCWLDVGSMVIFIAAVLHLVWTFNLELLFLNFRFYIFNQQRFRADSTTIPALQQALPVIGNPIATPYQNETFNLQRPKTLITEL